MQWLELIIARLDHQGVIHVKQLTKIYWHLKAPPSTPDFSGKVGLYLPLGLVTSCCSIRLNVGDLHAVRCSEGP